MKNRIKINKATILSWVLWEKKEDNSTPKLIKLANEGACVTLKMKTVRKQLKIWVILTKRSYHTLAIFCYQKLAFINNNKKIVNLNPCPENPKQKVVTKKGRHWEYSWSDSFCILPFLLNVCIFVHFTISVCWGITFYCLFNSSLQPKMRLWK